MGVIKKVLALNIKKKGIIRVRKKKRNIIRLEYIQYKIRNLINTDLSTKFVTCMMQAPKATAPTGVALHVLDSLQSHSLSTNNFSLPSPL